MPDDVARFLSSYDPSVRELALAARKLVLRLAPDAEEKVLRPWKTIAYGRARKFCAISPHKGWVRLRVAGPIRAPRGHREEHAPREAEVRVGPEAAHSGGPHSRRRCRGQLD